MEIETFTATELAAFIASERYKKMPYLPITPLRAISQCANPQVDKDDILLFLAVENGEMLGYCGMLPDTVYFSDGSNKRMAWITGLWVNPAIRGKGIGSFLVKTAFETWGKSMYVTEFEPKTLPIYQKLGLTFLHTLNGQTLYDLEKWADLLILKYSKLNRIAFSLHFLEKITRPFFALFHSKSDFSALSFQKIAKIDTETELFIQSHQKKALLRRNAAALNWVTDFPWLKEMPQKDEIAQKYYFSYQAKIFKQEWVQVREKETGKIVALFLLSQRDANLKIPYFFADKKRIKVIESWILTYFQKSSACMLHVIQNDLFQYLDNQPINIRIKKYSKPFLHYFDILDEKMHENPYSLIDIQDGDGDCVFT